MKSTEYSCRSDSPVTKALFASGVDLSGGEIRKIAVFDKGERVEYGTFEELMEQKRLYFDFFENKLNISKMHCIINEICYIVYYKVNSIGAYRC